MRQAALLGMPNCGKSSIYHLLTGRRTATGNRAGVTVTADTAPLSGPGERILLTDLPGIRSAHPASEDESVTLRYLKSQTPELLIAVLDATDAARQLPPVCELLRLARAGSLLMVFNFCDELERFPDAAELSRLLNIPVYAVSARTGQGIPELAAAVRAMAVAGGAGTSNGCLDCNRERRTGGASTNDPSPVCGGCAGCHRKAVHRTAKTQEKEEFGLPLGASHSKGGSGDAETGNPSHSRGDGRIKNGTDSEAAGRCAKPGAVYRTGFCIRTEQMTTVCSLLGRASEKKQRRSNRLDHLFLRPACGFPLFFLMMIFILWLTFGPPGEALTTGFCNLVLSPLSALLLRLCTGAPAWLASLLQNGVLGGVGAVLSFLPRLALLFLFQAVLEQCGLLARVNRLFDPIFCKFGLRGDAVTPLLLGFGCSVPAVLCTRAMKDRACRECCACFLPVVACSARMPLCLLIADCCFAGAGWVVCALVWLFSGICFLLFCALRAGWEKKTALADQHTDPLPRWRMPDWRELTGAVWAQTLHFLCRAGGMIFLFSVLIWLLSGFRPGVSGPVPAGESLLAMIGTWLAPLLSPLGLGDWRIAAALLAGVGAKEAALSTLGVLLGGGENLPAALAASGLLTPASALSLLIFYTLYFPCMATVSTLRRQQRRWLWLPLVFAYLLAAAVYRLSSLL